MPADQIGFHTCWPRNSSSMVAVPRSGKLLLLPQRPGTERRVPGGLGREEGFLNSKGGVEAEGNSSFTPLQGEGILPAELPPKRKVSPQRCRFYLAQLKRSAPQMVTRWHCSGFAYGQRETGPENDQTNGFMATSSLRDGSHLPSVVFSATATRELRQAMHVETEGVEYNKPHCLSLPIWGSRAWRRMRCC